MGNLASGYWWAGDHVQAVKTYDEAIALASKELQINPRDASVMGNLALDYAQKGDTRNGMIMIQRARGIDADSAELAYYDAEISYLAGKKADAVAALRDALKKGYPLEVAKADPWFSNAFHEPEFQAVLSAASSGASK